MSHDDPRTQRLLGIGDPSAGRSFGARIGDPRGPESEAFRGGAGTPGQQQAANLELARRALAGSGANPASREAARFAPPADAGLWGDLDWQTAQSIRRNEGRVPPGGGPHPAFPPRGSAAADREYMLRSTGSGNEAYGQSASAALYAGAAPAEVGGRGPYAGPAPGGGYAAYSARPDAGPVGFGDPYGAAPPGAFYQPPYEPRYEPRYGEDGEGEAAPQQQAPLGGEDAGEGEPSVPSAARAAGRRRPRRRKIAAPGSATDAGAPGGESDDEDEDPLDELRAGAFGPAGPFGAAYGPAFGPGSGGGLKVAGARPYSNVVTALDVYSPCRILSESRPDRGIFVFGLVKDGVNRADILGESGTGPKNTGSMIGYRGFSGDATAIAVSSFHVPALATVPYLGAATIPGTTFALNVNPGAPVTPATGTATLDNPLTVLPFGNRVTLFVEEFGSSGSIRGIDGANYHFELDARPGDAGVTTWLLETVPSAERDVYRFTHPKNVVPDRLTLHFRGPYAPLAFPQDVFVATAVIDGGTNELSFQILADYQEAAALPVDTRILVSGFASDQAAVDDYINSAGGLLVGDNTTAAEIQLNPIPVLPGVTITSALVAIVVPSRTFRVPLQVLGVVPMETNFGPMLASL